MAIATTLKGNVPMADSTKFIEVVETQTNWLFVVAAFVIGAAIVAGGIYALGKVVDNDNGNAGE